jgi:hypothetical protein
MKVKDVVRFKGSRFNTLVDAGDEPFTTKEPLVVEAINRHKRTALLYSKQRAVVWWLSLSAIEPWYKTKLNLPDWW